MDKDITLLEACIKLLESTLGSGMSSNNADEIVAQVIKLLKLFETDVK